MDRTPHATHPPGGSSQDRGKTVADEPRRRQGAPLLGCVTLYAQVPEHTTPFLVFSDASCPLGRAEGGPSGQVRSLAESARSARLLRGPLDACGS